MSLIIEFDPPNMYAKQTKTRDRIIREIQAWSEIPEGTTRVVVK